MNIDQVISFSRENSIESIDLKFTNLFGGIHHITLPVNMLTESLFERGVGIDGSSIPGFKMKDTSDMVLIPDPETAILDPFWERPTLSIICGVHNSETKLPYPLDRRQIIQHAERYLKETGVADRSMWGPEFEFNIFDAIYYKNRTNEASYRLVSDEAGWGNDDFRENDDSNLIPLQKGYHISPPQDRYFHLRDRMSTMIEKFGIPVKYHHHEVGRSGQSEIEINLVSALKAGDAAMNIKYILKNLASQVGCCVTFMPKPLYGEAGNGMHFHQHLFNGAEPVFYDEKGYAGLSGIAMRYIGGLLKHGRALLALTNPSTNSSKYANEPDRKRIEFRPPDGTCNVYIAIAAQLMAGIDGIINKIDPIEEGFGPYDDDITKFPEKEQAKIPRLPTTLSEAIQAFEDDNDFLLAGGVFNVSFLQNWINKLKNDIWEINNRPHPYEMQLYFDI